MIRVRNLSKRYGDFWAVRDISLDISAGEVIGFLGPNGAGKTTTMRMLTGFLGVDSGTIEIDGLPLAQNPELAKSKIGYLPENNPLYEDMTVTEYLRFVGEMRGIDAGDLDHVVKKNIELYGLVPMATRDVGQLSKGYRQRVGLAQAALHNPPIMILDEPTSGLDPNQIIEIRNLIREIGKTKTVILSTHNLSEVEATCSRILIINQGKIIADSTPEELERRGQVSTLYLRVKGGKNLDAAFKGIEGILDVKGGKETKGWIDYALSVDPAMDPDTAGERLFDAAMAGGFKISKMRLETGTLENVFTELTTGAE